MLTTVARWTGREASALREAMRAGVRDFAAHLGVSARTVSNWEAGRENICPRPDMQAVLDTCLERASREVKVRFVALLELGGSNLIVEEMDADTGTAPPSTLPQVVSPVDGKRMARIDTGTFLFGEDKKPLWLTAFYLDVTPTTNAEYAQFAAATGHPVPRAWADGQPPVGLAAHPVVGVTHADARAYAAWAGKSLPTSEQWEKAARGSGGIDFPWGNHRTSARCNVRETGIGHTTPVTRYHSGISPSGVYDLAGNVWEWCDTPTGPGRFVLRGSAFTSSLDMARTFAVNDASAEMFDEDTGFRCACAPGDLDTAAAGQNAAASSS